MSSLAAPPRRRLRERETQLLLSVLLAAAAAVAVGPHPALLGLLWLAAVTPPLIAVDTAELRLPDRIVLPGYPVALASAVLADAAGGTPVAVAVPIALGTGLVLLVLHVAGGMGLGDVKLAPVLGLVAAAVSPAAGVATPIAAFLVGGAAAAALLVRRGAGAHMPFGPSMLLGAWAAVLLL